MRPLPDRPEASDRVTGPGVAQKPLRSLLDIGPERSFPLGVLAAQRGYPGKKHHGWPELLQTSGGNASQIRQINVRPSDSSRAGQEGGRT